MGSEALAQEIAALQAATEEARRLSIQHNRTIQNVYSTPPPVQGPVQAPVSSQPLPDLRQLRSQREFQEALQRPYDSDRFVQEQLRNLQRNNLDAANQSLRSRGIEPVSPADPSGFRPSSVDRPPATANNPNPRPLPPSNPPIRSTGPDRTPITRTPRTMGHNYSPRATEPLRTGMPTGFAEPLPRQVQLEPGPAPTLPSIPTAGTLPRSMVASQPLSGALAAGRSVMPMAAVGGVLSFGMGLAAGEDPRRAALGGLGATAGTVGGAVLGSFFGPAGTMVGGTVGGVLGDMAGDGLSNLLGLPISSADPGIENQLGPQVPPWLMPQFVGGGDTRTYFVHVYAQYITTYDYDPNSIGVVSYEVSNGFGRPGPIRGLTSRTYTSSGNTYSELILEYGNNQTSQVHSVSNGYGYQNYRIVAVVPTQGDPTNVGPSQPRFQEMPTNPTYSFPGRQPHPLNSPQLNYAPNSTPNPGGSPRPADSPVFVPSGYPNARNEPNPQSYNLGGPMPALQPQRSPDPRPEAEPEGAPFPGSYGLSLPLGTAGPEAQTTPTQQGNHTASPTPLQNLFPGQSALPGLLPVVARAPQQQTNLRNTPTLDNAPGTGDRNAPQPAAQPSQQAGTGTATGEAPTPTCRFRDDPYSAEINQRTITMEQIELAIQAYQTQMLAAIDTKLGPQIPNGGLSGLLQKVGNLTKKTWDFLQVDRILSVLTYVTALHNAYQLSANLTATLFDMFSGVLDAIGIENDDGSPLDISGMVNRWTENFFKGLIGEESVEGMKAAWLKYSRIYQAAMNIIYTVSSIVDSLRSLTEIVGENVGKIGNALRRSGAVMESSFGWMQEKLDSFSVGNNRWEKLFSRIDQVDNVASSIGMAAGEVVSIKENLDQMKTDRQEMKVALADVGFGESPESEPIADKEQDDKEDSEAPRTLENPQVGTIE